MIRLRGLLPLAIVAWACLPLKVDASETQVQAASPFGWKLGGPWAPQPEWKCYRETNLSPEVILCGSAALPLRGAWGYSVELQEGKLHKATALFRFSRDRYGDKARGRMRSLRDALANKYGAPRELDLLKKGALYDEPQYWTMSLWKNERVRAAGWRTPQFTVILTVIASSPSDTVLGLQYEDIALGKDAQLRAEQQETKGL